VYIIPLGGTLGGWIRFVVSARPSDSRAGYRVIRVRNRDVSREHLEAALREALGTNR